MRRAGIDELISGTEIGGGNINILRYADDVILISGSENELCTLLSRIKKSSEEFGLRLNVKKTKVLSTAGLQVFNLDRMNIEVVSSFKLL